MNYLVAIPTTPAVVPGALHVTSQAPAIVAGQLMTANEVVDAAGEVKSREKVREINPAIVSVQNVADSRRRYAKVLGAQFINAGVPGLAPPWALQLGQQIQQLGQQIQQQGQQIQQQGQQLGQQIQVLQGLLGATNARVFNIGSFAANLERLNRPVADNVVLSPIHKTIAGNGAVLPGIAVVVPPAPVVVGQAIPHPFPADTHACRQLTLAQLSVLAVLCNNNFGVVANDGVVDRRAKFRLFITGFIPY
jgi:hypothetical protein